MVNTFGITKSSIALLIAFAITLGLVASSHADTIGAGMVVRTQPEPELVIEDEAVAVA
jgi:hypothetical protein